MGIVLAFFTIPLLLIGSLAFKANLVDYAALDNFSSYMGCYPNWGYNEAREDFKEQYKGSLSRLEKSKNCKGQVLSAQTDVTPTPTPTQNTKKTVQKNLITCTGPDYKTFQSTQEECDNFNSAWGKKPYQAPQQYQSGNTGLISYRCEIEGKVYLLKVKSESDGQYYCNDNKRLVAELRAESAQWEAEDAELQKKLNEELNKITTTTYTPGPTIAPITYEPLPTLPQNISNCYMRTQSDPNDRCLNGISLSGEQCYQVCN